MTEIKKPDIQSYHPEMGGEILNVEKGWCHFSHQGTKDFLDYITAFQAETDGVSFLVRTFRGNTARVCITFVSETAFRLRMLPHDAEPRLNNQVFDLSGIPGIQVKEEDFFITAESARLTLSFRKCPWEMTVTLDGELLTKEQIKDLCIAVDTVLTPQERQVIVARYGLGGGKALRQREVAQVTGISRSYVSRIEKKALQKLREELD